MERRVVYNFFRNIGVDEQQHLILNNSTKIEELGNLILLIGTNNSGKSNVLDGLLSFNNKHLDKNDITFLKMEEKFHNPSLFLEYIQHGKKEPFYRYEINKKQKIFPTEKITIEKTNDNKKILEEIVKKVIEKLKEFEPLIKTKNWSLGKNDKIRSQIINWIKQPKKTLGKLKEKTILKIFKTADDINVKNEKSFEFTFKKEIEQISNYENFKLIKENKQPETIKEEKIIPKKEGYFLGEINVIKFTESNIKTKDLKSNFQNISKNPFLQNLINNSNITNYEIENAYRLNETFNNGKELKKLSERANEVLKVVKKDFNKTFKLDDEYEFHLDFGKEKNIVFEMYRGKQKIIAPLDLQSGGFKWFFDFYFNLLMNNNLKEGDILILDEPGVRMQFSHQSDLKKLLKDYAIRKGITIVIATHNVSFIDPDNYEELRFINNDSSQNSHILNSFADVHIKSVDTLNNIIKGMTIDQYHLYKHSSKIIWVEGATDYGYLTLFKKILEIDQIYFIPIQGVTLSPSNSFAEVIKKLETADFINPIILTDADQKGLESQKVSKEVNSKIKHITLFDVFKNDQIKEIEDLFSEEDIKNYPFISKKQHSQIKIIKDRYSEYSFSEETVNNFKKLFSYLLKD